MQLPLLSLPACAAAALFQGDDRPVASHPAVLRAQTLQLGLRVEEDLSLCGVLVEEGLVGVGPAGAEMGLELGFLW